MVYFVVLCVVQVSIGARYNWITCHEKNWDRITIISIRGVQAQGGEDERKKLGIRSTEQV